MKSAFRYCFRGYWMNVRPDLVLKGMMEFLWMTFKILFFIPYFFLDILFSLLVAPFVKQIDKFEEAGEDK
jgi:hypothetical protein